MVNLFFTCLLTKITLRWISMPRDFFRVCDQKSHLICTSKGESKEKAQVPLPRSKKKKKKQFYLYFVYLAQY